MSAPQPGTPRTIYVQWSVDGNHIRKWSWSEFDLAERLNAETVSVSDPKAQALADAGRQLLEDLNLIRFKNCNKSMADFAAALADWEGK